MQNPDSSNFIKEMIYFLDQFFAGKYELATYLFFAGFILFDLIISIIFIARKLKNGSKDDGKE